MVYMPDENEDPKLLINRKYISAVANEIQNNLRYIPSILLLILIKLETQLDIAQVVRKSEQVALEFNQ